MKKIFFFSLLMVTIVSCTNKQSNATESELKEGEKNVVEEIQKTEFAVKKDSYIYKFPKSDEKVINQKATDILGEMSYCKIDNDCVVKILASDGDWLKIQVVDPEWLRDSHVGWVEKSCVDINDNKVIVEEGTDYEIMLKEVNGYVTNYYIKNITCELSESELYMFAKAIKEQLGGKCNIQIYSSDKVKSLMTKYPLRGQEYIKVADEFVYLLAFDGTNFYYPFQDILYNEYGGKNWKKTPIK